MALFHSPHAAFANELFAVALLRGSANADGAAGVLSQSHACRANIKAVTRITAF